MSFPDHHHHHYPPGEQQQPSMNSASYYPQSPYDLHMYAAMEDLLPTFTVDVPMPSPLLYDLATVKHKLHQVETILSSVAQGNPAPAAVAEAAALMQDIVVAASSTVLSLQQMMSSEPPPPPPVHPGQPAAAKVEPQVAGEEEEAAEEEEGEEGGNNAAARDDVIEIDAANLLAKYTHHCQICGKGFKRDANLRMHMRAHGDEYKSSAALARPARGKGEAAAAAGRRYSCPQEGCRWNRKHARFQPLKSMVCVKNHYRRSHCPKLYVCQRCGRKQFSVLSDLRTHEKHCGDLKWRCSCGTTFSRKDKLMGHAALFAGHLPILPDGGDF